MDEAKKQELRKNIRLNWLYSLSALADIELQQRWLDKRITNPAWSYVEFRCSYFDDTSLSDGGYEKMIRNGFVTHEEYNCIKNFHDALDKYKEPNGHYDPAAILDDPTWQKIVALGKQSIDKLAIILADPEEKKALLENLPTLTEKDFSWPN